MEQELAKEARPGDVRRLVSGTLAFVFLFTSTWLLNLYLFPILDSVLISLRDIVEVFSGVVFITIAFVARSTLAPFKSRHLVPLAIGATGLAFLVPIGFAVDSDILIVIGALVNGFAGGLIFAALCVSCLDLDSKSLGIIILAAYIVSLLLRNILPSFTLVIGSVIFLFTRLATALLVMGRVTPNMDEMGDREVRDAQLEQPSSFVKLTSRLFICIFVFRFVFGVALTYNEVDRIPLISHLELVLFLVSAVGIGIHLKRRGRLEPDWVFNIAVIAVLAGFIIIPASSVFPLGIVNGLLYFSAGLFDVVFWYTLITIGTRNKLGAITAFSWATAMRAFGVTLGAFVGRHLTLTGSSEQAIIAIATTMCLFVGYSLHFVRKRGFAGVIASVTPVAAPVVEMEPDTRDEVQEQSFEERCDDIAERYGLTTRERDVFGLLARGRNGHYIQESLTVSYNTVKTHVLHIYTKLDVHSQQELIDLVEGVEA